MNTETESYQAQCEICSAEIEAEEYEHQNGAMQTVCSSCCDGASWCSTCDADQIEIAHDIYNYYHGIEK